MTVNLNIKPDLEARLVAEARAAGQPLERFIEDVLERQTAAPDANGSHALAGSEKARAFRKWANSFPAGFPVLSLEDVSRESIYRRDE
jgi:hypothetical protein